jgi:hypothetical protein
MAAFANDNGRETKTRRANRIVNLSNVSCRRNNSEKRVKKTVQGPLNLVLIKRKAVIKSATSLFPILSLRANNPQKRKSPAVMGTSCQSVSPKLATMGEFVMTVLKPFAKLLGNVF